jgi:serine/threonine protein kinase
MQLKKGTQLKNGQYTIVRTLGIGGFGITYLAMSDEQVTGKLGGFNVQVPVAVKEFFVSDNCLRDKQSYDVIIPATGSMDKIELYRRKFIKEAHSMAQLHHKNIVKVSDVFEENNTVYYAMQFLDGGSLRDVVSSKGPLDEATAKRYVLQIANALSYMHNEHHLCHLDVKPGNIMLNQQGEAVLIDFGIAKRYDSHGEESTVTPVGISKGYSPLEQYNGTLHDYSPQTDVYGLGATFYYLLTGLTPPDANAVLEQKGLGKKPDAISQSTWNIICKAMQPLRSERVASVDEFIHLLNTQQLPSISQQSTSCKKRDDEKTVVPGQNIGNVIKSAKVTHAQNVASARNTRRSMPNMKRIATVLLGLILLGFIVWYVLSTNKAPVLETVSNYRWNDMTYNGTLLQGVPEGKGRAVYDDGRIYEGHFVHGKRNDPHAYFVYANKLVFQGCFDADTIRNGRVDTPAGDIYFMGDFSGGKPYNGYWYYKNNNQKALQIINGKEYRK